VKWGEDSHDLPVLVNRMADCAGWACVVSHGLSREPASAVGCSLGALRGRKESNGAAV